MKLNEKIYMKIKENNMITTAQVIGLGFSKAILSKYVKAGLLERSRQGIYILPNAIEDDMYTMGLRSERIIFSHESALFLNGLAERTPFKHSITIPSNTSLPSSIKGECRCFYVKEELHKVGLVERSTTFGNKVKCYNVERTICDIMRSRNKLNEETVISAIKKYAAFPDKDLNMLAKYAQLFKVNNQLKKYLEVLL